MASKWMGLFLLVVGVGAAWSAEGLLRGQSLFVPVFSEIPYGNRGAVIQLSATVTIRNLDSEQSITVSRVEYIDEKGQVVKRYIDAPKVLGPMVASEFFLPESDRSGGGSAGFNMEWSSVKPVRPPLVESVMLNGAYNQKIAFRSEARVLEARP